MNVYRLCAWMAFALTLELAIPVTAARAELVLSQLVVELSPGKQSRTDVELWNDGPERTYVSVEPREVLRPGTPAETRREEADPEKLGLLVSPARVILESGQRRLLRIADIAPAAERERVYRVTVKPVVGQLSSPASGLKVLIGYDVLVLVRPAEFHPHVSGVRRGDQLLLRNDGNVSVELVNGKDCDPSGKSCSELPEGRLYAGAEKSVLIDPDRRAHYQVKVANKVLSVEF